MYWTSVLPVTIFMLAHTLGVSQSAATGRQRLMSSESEAVGGGSRPLQQEEQQQREDDADLPLRPASFPSSAASSIESAVPADWINFRSADKDNAVLDENDDAGDDNDEEEWGDVPLSPGSSGNFRYDQLGGGLSAVGPNKDPLLLQQPSSPYNTHTKSNNNNNHLMLLTPENLAALRRYYRNGGGVVGGGLMKRGDKLKHIYLATKLSEQAALQPSARTHHKSNYQLPAESNIVRGNFDKRSPRCIANCMRQGLVHPIQCHSLCRKR